MIDHTTTDVVAAVEEPVDVLLNLAPIDPGALAAMTTKVRDGGVVVITTVWMDPPSDEDRGVRGVPLFVNSDAGQLAELVDLIDKGELRTDVADRVPLAELRSVHAKNDAGELPGKVVIVVEES